MKIVTKQRWNEAIAAEDNGWDFHNEDMYMKHDFGAKHGQIVTYAKHMMLFEDFSNDNQKPIFDYSKPIFDLQQKTIVDICGGPCSLLLRCHNFKKAIVVDPGNFPEYITQRYKNHGIEVCKVPAEEFVYPEKVDEVWLYNALAHVYNPYDILLNAKKNSKKMRIIEGVNCGTDIQHPQNLKREELEKVLETRGSIVETNDPEPSPRGLHFVAVFDIIK